MFDSADVTTVLALIDEHFAPYGHLECAERATERFSEAVHERVQQRSGEQIGDVPEIMNTVVMARPLCFGGVICQNFRPGAWSEAVGAGGAGETDRMAAELEIDTKSCTH